MESHTASMLVLQACMVGGCRLRLFWSAFRSLLEHLYD